LLFAVKVQAQPVCVASRDICGPDTEGCKRVFPDIPSAFAEWKRFAEPTVAKTPKEACLGLYVSYERTLLQGGGSGFVGGSQGQVPLARYRRSEYLLMANVVTALECKVAEGGDSVITKTRQATYNEADVFFGCIPPPNITIGFFNGVGKTRQTAIDSLDRLKSEYGEQYKNTALKYELFYNQTACRDGWLGKVSCLEDLAEVFEQRTIELEGVFAKRWETYWDLLAGRYRSEESISGQLLGLFSTDNPLLQWLIAADNALSNALAASFLKIITLFAENPTYENRQQHLDRLTALDDNYSRLVLVAHSQGNLFVNSAYDALKATRPFASATVVHVAPASPTLRGKYILADIDLVINALRATGTTSVPGNNIEMPKSLRDRSGHGFEATYLDKAREAYARTKDFIKENLDRLAD
jgi:hypothetical protein